MFVERSHPTLTGERALRPMSTPTITNSRSQQLRSAFILLSLFSCILSLFVLRPTEAPVACGVSRLQHVVSFMFEYIVQMVINPNL